MSDRILVLGQGAWGQALVHVAKSSGHEVVVWRRGNQMPSGKFDAAVIAVPAQAVRSVLAAFPKIEISSLIIAAKGIEQDSQKFMAEVAAEVLPKVPALVLSGPSFAADVLKGLPTAVSLAAPTMELAQTWAIKLSLPVFRIYASDDVLGVEIGGAFKNVLAIACGISAGKKLGDSAQAALTTRGFAELSRFGAALGAKPETLIGLSGLGDLLLTCSSPQSRNFSYGFRIGEGATPHEAMSASCGVVEGVYSAAVAAKLAILHSVDMPIIAAVAAIVHNKLDPDQAIRQLLDRPLNRAHS